MFVSSLIAEGPLNVWLQRILLSNIYFYIYKNNIIWNNQSSFLFESSVSLGCKVTSVNFYLEMINIIDLFAFSILPEER